jgi:streptomycin 6-kinase
MIGIPEEFARATTAREGEPGRKWIASLPALIDELLQRWSSEPDGPMMHGCVGVVLPVRYKVNTPAVIKVSYPHHGNIHEPNAFQTWNGRGAVRLHERDDEHYAMLLERAESGTLADVADFDHAVTILGRLSHRLAVATPIALPRLSDLVSGWESRIRLDAAELNDPLPRHVIDTATATLRELGPDQPATLVHGDLHDSNVLRGSREPWLAIDPKGYVGDPAYDAITVVRSPRFALMLKAPDAPQGLLRGLDIYCDAAEIDPGRARRWIQFGAVRASLWGRRYGDPEWLIQASDLLAHRFA